MFKSIKWRWFVDENGVMFAWHPDDRLPQGNNRELDEEEAREYQNVRVLKSRNG